METPDALTFKNVSKKLGRTQALDNLSFRIPVGSVSAFVGNNGAGKTTTFSIVARYLRLSRGAIHIFGMPLAQYYRKGGIVGVLPQDAEFFDDVRVWKQIAYFCRLAGFGGKSAREETERVLNLCSLSDKAESYSGDLSRGMRVRLGVAQALIASPRLLLLDEPTAGLDPGMVLQFRELVDIVKKEATVVISSHDVSELEQMCDYVCYIDKGSLVREEPIGVLQKEISRVIYTVERELPEFSSFATAFADCNFSRRDKNKLVVDFDPGRFALGDLNKKILSWLFDAETSVLEVRPESSIERLFRDR